MKKFLQKILLLFLATFIVGGALRADHLSDELLIAAKLTGDQSVPEVDTDGVGVASFFLNSTRDTLCVNVSVANLSGPITAAHVHTGVAGTNGDVVTGLTDFVQGNRIVAMLTGDDLTPAIIANYLTGQYYLNIHTDANPNGEIRGQLLLESDYGFRADINGDQVTPANGALGTGVAIVNVSHDKTKLTYEVVVNGLTGAITAAHLHDGTAGNNGPVLVDLTAAIDGNTISGVLDISENENILQMMVDEGVYLNIHTDANPNGEVRGQVVLDSDLAFDTMLTTDQETTPVMGTAASGVAYVSMNATFDGLDFNVQTEGLSGAIMGAHFHMAEFGEAGEVVLNITDDVIGDNIIGTVSSEDLTPEIISAFLTGGIYINIHTETNPNGEIRGQVYRLAREGYAYALEGSQSVPPHFAAATGSGMMSMNREQSNIHFMTVFGGLSGQANAAHFHNASAGMNGGVIFNLSDLLEMTGNEDSAFGYWDVEDETSFDTDAALAFRNDEVYLNVHTDLYPDGEIRGQILRGAVCFTHQMVDAGQIPMDPNFTPNLLFSAKLTGDQEVPAVATEALGVAGFLLTPNRDSIIVNINVDGLSGPITGAHIHEGAMGENGDVVINFSENVTGYQIKTAITDFDLNNFMTGAYYLNIHTTANPNGEIRGQIGFETDKTYTADIDGTQSGTDAGGYGRGVFNLLKSDGALEVRFVATALTGPITAVHFHNSPMGQNGDVVLDLTPFLIGNTVDTSVDPSAFLEELKAGNIYLNIHTAANPNGEIRGQVLATEGLVFDTWANGAQSNPANQVSGKALGLFWTNAAMDAVQYDVVSDFLTGPIDAAHVHDGALGENGGVAANLTSGIDGNRISGMISGAELTPALLTSMLLGNNYLNIHTAVYPDGEIRGQVYRLARDGYTFDMCGAQEEPFVDALGYGGGIASVDRNGSTLHIMATTTGLSGDITGAHIHDGVAGTNGPVLYGLTDLLDNNSVFSYVDLEDADGALIKSGGTYLNIHTALNADGELRGQIDNTMSCPPIIVGVEELETLSNVAVFPNPFVDNISVNLEGIETAKMVIRVVDNSGNVVYSENISDQRRLLQLDMSELSSGFYTLTLWNGTHFHSQKLIKQ